jgi:hypothetical protein
MVKVKKNKKAWFYTEHAGCYYMVVEVTDASSVCWLLLDDGHVIDEFDSEQEADQMAAVLTAREGDES